jgi:hypothetical protein
MVVKLFKGEQFRASNQVQLVNSNYERPRDEDIIHQLPENLELVKKALDSTKEVADEATNKHAFC